MWRSPALWRRVGLRFNSTNIVYRMDGVRSASVGTASGSHTTHGHAHAQVTKKIPGGKTLLKDVNLQFLTGAKIGVLGVNGAFPFPLPPSPLAPAQ
jgi:hypothetical protein